MYSVPAREETYGILENWNLVQKNRKKRRGGSASKIAGPNPNHMREKNDFAGKYKIRFRQ
jgi:hypothetical protein